MVIIIHTDIAKVSFHLYFNLSLLEPLKAQELFVNTSHHHEIDMM